MAFKEIDLSDPEFKAMCYQARRWTRDLRDLVNTRVNGTGIAVRMGARRFLATAGHLVKESHPMQIVSREGESSIPTDFANAGWDEGADVGFLELSQEQADMVGDFAGGENILCVWPRELPQSVIVVGYPEEMHFSPSPQVVASVLTQIQLITVPTPEWPDNLDREPEQGRDLFLRLPEETYGQLAGPSVPHSGNAAVKGRTPRPHGMSGGGIWLLAIGEKVDSGLVLPGIQLLAIQTSWYDRSRMLRGTLVAKWLDLVAAEYPDLRDEIDQIQRRSLDTPTSSDL